MLGAKGRRTGRMGWRSVPLLVLALAWTLGATACGGGSAGGGVADGRDDAGGGADVSLPDGGGPGGGDADAHGVKPDGGAPPDGAEADAGEDAGGEDAGVDAGAGDDVPPPPPPCTVGEPCDDGDPCTADDACVDGVCGGTPHPCDDGLTCTADVCDGAGGCTFVLRGSRCLIDGVCFDDGAPNPEDGCQACLPPLATDAWSPGPAVACDDGDACTVGDTCHDGVCAPGPAPDCGESNPCVAASCDPATGCVTTDLDGADCTDGDACTLGDVCDGGVCQPGLGAPTCADENPCTDDGCEPGVGCVTTDNTADCDDGDPCTTDEQCQGGACVAAGGPLCDDGNECTDDACQPGVGCVHVNNTAGCEDGDPCSLGDRCVVGTCRPGTARPDCGDGEPCTDDVCEPGVGCVNPPNTNPCDDGSLCTENDTCGGGECVSGTTVNCDDDDPCTDDTCDPLRGCLYDYNAAGCEDGNPCTVGDLCIDGACLPGPDPLVCNDGDPCTNDWCLMDVGCQADPTSGVPCSDDDPCTVGDICATGQCLPGVGRLPCDDGNDCTVDRCDAGVGCAYLNLNSGPCDDHSVCTEADRCVEGGVCTGYAMPCIDGNICTEDACDPIDGCFFPAIQTIDCWPVLSISPQRGVTLNGWDSVPVQGTVLGVASPVTSLVINGEDVPFDPATGVFSYMMTAAHGMNMIRLDVEDAIGSRREVRQSFYLSDKYWAMNPADWDASRVEDGIQFYLSDQVIDDGDRTDVDDLASIFDILLGSFDLNALIPRPAARETVDMGLWDCDYDIYIDNITYARPRVTLIPGQNTLRVLVLIDNFRTYVDANGDGFECPGIDATVTASRITIDTTVSLVLGPAGLTAAVVSNNVTIDGLNVEGGNFLSDFLLGFFEDDIKDQLESAFEDQIGDMIPEMLQDALGQLALHQDFSLPAFLPGQTETTVTLDSRMASFALADTGMVIGLDTVIQGPRLTPYTIEGAISRGTCIGTDQGGLSPILRTHNLELALHDDVLNQILYSVWAAGTFEISVTAEQLGQDLSSYGISDLDLDISFMLPPIAEWCVAEEPMLLQIGDIRIDASFSLLGQPLDVIMFASLQAEGGIDLVESEEGGLELALAIHQIEFIDVDIASVNVGFEDFIPALRGLIEDELLPSLLGGLADGALGSFPIPTIDLSGFDESIPEGTGIAIAPQEIWRFSGFTAVGGDMQSSGK